MEENKATISYKDFEADVKAKEDEIKILHWLGQDIEVKKYLSLQEVLLFVSNVVDVCYQEENETFVYKPEVQAYAVRHTLISMYTNIDLAEPDDDETKSVDFSAYDFVTRSGIVDEILKIIDLEQYEAVIKAIAAKIKYINEANSAAIMSEMSALNNVINDIVPQVQEIFAPENEEKLQSALQALNLFTEDATIRKLAMEQVKHD